MQKNVKSRDAVRVISLQGSPLPLRWQEEMMGTLNLSVFEGSVEDVLLDGDTIKGIVTADGTEIACKSVVVTTGTFLRGKCYIGQVRNAQYWGVLF